MKRRSKLGAIVVASAVVLLAGQVVVAQVEWTPRDLCVGPGEPGDWDAQGHQVGDVVFDGAFYHMYLIGGSEGSSLEDPWSVGHWTSTDVTGPWEEDPQNPVLEPGASRAWDSFSIINVAVQYDGAMFHMWYGAAGTYHGPVHGGYATNLDGRGDWDKHPDNPLPGLGPGDPGSWNERGPTPSTVLVDGSSHSMWYTAAQDETWGTWRIGHATSPDGLDWTSHHPEPVLQGSAGWEGIRVYSPEVVFLGTGDAMWYSGVIEGPLARIGYAESPDGVNWSKYPFNPVLSPVDPCYALQSIAVMIEDDTVHGWIAHCDVIWHVTAPLNLVFFDGWGSGDTTAWSVEIP